MFVLGFLVFVYVYYFLLSLLAPVWIFPATNSPIKTREEVKYFIQLNL